MLSLAKMKYFAIACSLETRYLYDKLHKLNDEVAELMMEKNRARINPNYIDQSVLEN